MYFLTVISLGLIALSWVEAQSEHIKLCPDDWFDGGDLGCYKLLESAVNLTWVEAQSECEQIGGYLAEPKTSSHAVLLEELVALEAEIFGINYWYIGLTDLGREGNWVWQHSGEALTDNHWRKNRPVTTFGNNKDCGAMVVKDGAITWQDFSCTSPVIKTHPVAAVCEHSIVPSEDECPYQWTKFDRHCYKLFKEPAFWHEANNECLAHGANMVSVHSAEEDEFVTFTLVNDDYSFWLGGYPTNEHKWVWSDGSEFDYMNNGSLEVGNCIQQETSTDGWTTMGCYNSNYFVCKI